MPALGGDAVHADDQRNDENHEQPVRHERTIRVLAARGRGVNLNLFLDYLSARNGSEPAQGQGGEKSGDDLAIAGHTQVYTLS